MIRVTMSKEEAWALLSAIADRRGKVSALEIGRLEAVAARIRPQVPNMTDDEASGIFEREAQEGFHDYRSPLKSVGEFPDPDTAPPMSKIFETLEAWKKTFPKS